MDYSFQFNVVWDNIGWLLEGVRVTLIVTFGSRSTVLRLGVWAAVGHGPSVRASMAVTLGPGLRRNLPQYPALVQLIWVWVYS